MVCIQTIKEYIYNVMCGGGWRVCAGEGCMVEGIGCVQVTVVWWRV